MTLACADIGISGCDFTVRDGEDASALDQMIRHLGRMHGFHMTAQEVTEGRIERLDEPERMVAARLRRRLEMA